MAVQLLGDQPDSPFGRRKEYVCKLKVHWDARPRIPSPKLGPMDWPGAMAGGVNGHLIEIIGKNHTRMQWMTINICTVAGVQWIGRWANSQNW